MNEPSDFDPATVLQPGEPTRQRTSPLIATLDYVATGDLPSWELTDLLGYTPQTWSRMIVRHGGLLWRTRKVNGNGHRYWIVKKDAATP